MAKMVPSYISDNVKSSGERQIFELFKNAPGTKDWTILHSLCLAKHSKRLYGEIDFLVMAPGLGIFCLEVKSGDIKRENGLWKFINRFNEVSTSHRGPFQQSQEGMFSLISSIKKKFGENSRYSKLLFGFGVMFPHITYQIESIEYELWQIFDRNSRQKPIEDFIKRLHKNTLFKIQNQKWFDLNDSLPSKDDIEKLVNFLRCDFERITSAKDELSDTEDRIFHFTAEQFNCLDQLSENSRCLFHGAAGTGKTMIALESARRLAYNNQKVLFICFNKLLSKWLNKQIKNINVKINNFHSFITNIASNEFDNKLNKYTHDDNFYSNVLPEIALDSLFNGNLEQFDVLIIDEGQDLISEKYLDIFDTILKGGLNGGRWQIFCDFERQAIYSKNNASQMIEMLELKAQFVKFKLKTNCRNTKNICMQTSILSGFETPPCLPAQIEGPPVEYYFYTSTVNQIELINFAIKEILKSGTPPQHITILSPLKFCNSCINALNQSSNINRLNDDNNYDKMFDQISFSTVHGFKGLENSYIILSDIAFLNDEFKSLLYVAMSRARVKLILFIDQKAKIDYEKIIIKGLDNNERKNY